MRTGPDASEQHHRAMLPASALLSPAQMSCPRGIRRLRTCLRSRVSWSLGVAGEWAAGPVDQVDDHGMRRVSCSCSSAESVSEGIRKW